MLWMLMLGCAPIEPSWALLDPVAAPAAEAPQVQPPSGADSRFTEYEEAVAEGENPWGDMKRDSRGNLITSGDEPTEAEEPVEAPEGEATEDSETEPAEAEAVDEEPAEDDRGDADPVGVADQAAWGVRLIQTLDTRQPPKAVLGMPDGEELIVTSGSMLPDVGIVVIAVGKDMVQLAHVIPEGDHAEIETKILNAQYGSGAENK